MRPLIFDCDGVLVDSEYWSCSSWLPVLQRRHIETDLATIETFKGLSDQAILDHFDLTSTPELIAEREEEYFRLARQHLQTFPGLRQLLQHLHGLETPMGVASSGSRPKIDFSLNHVGLGPFLPLRCSSTQVPRGKPAPDLFLYTAQGLGVEPAQCAVVEDSIPGIEAARSAGMIALGFTSSFPAATLHQAGAHHTFAAYGELLPLLQSLAPPS
ncbi:MAG: HAD-IA family hydrolase [Candidatus Latescibacteria bacterium]|nr:HAD-IA family hydrolase [Candidatus Latescibacterota bacterium]